MRNQHQTKQSKKSGSGTAAWGVLLAALLCVLAFFIYKNVTAGAAKPEDDPAAAATTPVVTQMPTPTPDTAEPTPDVTPEPTPTPMPEFHPAAVDSTAPEKLVGSTGIMVNGETVGSYEAAEPIDFGYGEDYTQMEGVITFRGDNFRGNAAYGTVSLTEKEFGTSWTLPTGSINGADGAFWSGNGWTGQPLIVKWSKDVRQHMNMYDWAKEKDELVEVIYASMDGNIYFTELNSGSKTRDTMFLGYTFKGAGALDPRGYPILYVGAGYDSTYGGSHAFVISLLDGSILYEFGQYDSFANRPWHMFDSSALVDAETDQLIYPGESGILYIIKLNTQYDADAGTLRMDPDPVVKWKYNTARSFGWLGMESSAVIWRGHIIMSDNGGRLMCLDLNTLELDWVQDILDDSNSTPMLELENGHPYVYVSTSFHLGWRSWNSATVPVWKIDAVTGEIVWQTDYSCQSVEGVSGGVQGSPAMGENNLSDLVFFPVARTGGIGAGKLAALDKATGEVVWEFSTQVYSWSSPVIVYDEAGNGYIIYCAFNGYVYLLDGRTGEVLDDIYLNSNLEASPAVYENTMVVGTRANGIWGITLQ
jgi:hypothetical protein